MAESSRGRVTITLGRTGQVVKRSGDVSDVGFSDSLPGAGSKRSIRDRLGRNSDSLFVHGSQVINKRQKRQSYASTANSVNDVRISKDDLRYKLIQKNVFRRAQSDEDHKGRDLREKLSRTGQPSPNSLDRRPRMPESKSTSILGQIPSTRSADDLARMDSSRNSYSTWTLDHLRRRSPDRMLATSRRLSPANNFEQLPRRNIEELPRRPLSMAYDDIRAVPYTSSSIPEASRPVTTTPFISKSALASEIPKPVTPVLPFLGHLPPPNGVVQKVPYTGGEQQTVEALLHSLGLGKYAITFKAEEVDMAALKQMGEHDLKELGIPMGPRKKILLALLPRSKRHP